MFLGVGRSILGKSASAASGISCQWPQRCLSAAYASPTVPETQMSSPGFAPARVSPFPSGSEPIAVIEIVTGACVPPTSAVRVVSPPRSAQPELSARAIRPREKPASHSSSRSGSPIERKNARGDAPAAARSDRLTARAL